MAAFDPDVRRKLLRVAPKRPSDSGIFESVQGREDFCYADVGFGGSLSDVTNLIGGRASARAFAGFGREPALALMDAVA